jgi:hypothetical protein
VTAARAPLAPRPPAAGRVPGGAPARDQGGRRRRLRGLALHRTAVAADELAGVGAAGAAYDYRLEGPLAVDLAVGHHAGRERVAELAARLVAEEVAPRGRIARATAFGRLYCGSLMMRSNTVRRTA